MYSTTDGLSMRIGNAIGRATFGDDQTFSKGDEK
jgi:hypothetical protein